MKIVQFFQKFKRLVCENILFLIKIIKGNYNLPTCDLTEI